MRRLRYRLDRELTWRDWAAAFGARLGKATRARPKGPPEAREWTLRADGVAGASSVRALTPCEWELVLAEPLRAVSDDVASQLGAVPVGARELAREVPGVIDYTTGWWDDGLGEVRFVREPEGEVGLFRIVVVMDAAYWGPRPSGSERERIFDHALGERSGEVDTERLIAELCALESSVRDDALSDLREWLEAAIADRARVRFERD